MTYAQEKELVEALRPQYEAAGYEFIIDPPQSFLPPSVKDYRPDAIAFKGSDKIAIELVSPSPAAIEKAQRLRGAFAGLPGWEFRVVYLSSAPRVGVPSLSMEELRQTIAEADELCREGHMRAALIVAWSALEALGRFEFPEQFRRPQTPATLLEGLASQGYLSPDASDDLRPLIAMRNQAVHGGPADYSKEPIEKLIAILKRLTSGADKAS